MLNLGFSEIALIVILAIVVVGPEDIPKMMRVLGQQYGRLMRASNELRRAFMMEVNREENEKRAEELRQRREEARKRAEELRARALAQKPGQDEGGLPRPPAPVPRPDQDIPTAVPEETDSDEGASA